MKNKIIISDKKVIKKYHSIVAWENENKVLSILQRHGICPAVKSIDNKMIEMSFIDGRTLSDIIDENTDLTSVFKKLADFIIVFNELAENIVLEDINLKNFIFSDGNIYGIDFEKWHYGDNTVNLAAVLTVINNAHFKDELAKAQLYNSIKEYIINVTGCKKDEFEQLIGNENFKIATRRQAMKKIRKSDCVIIAGGKSSRMGSPKGLLNYKGHSFIDHIIYNTSVFDRQYISANGDLYRQFECQLIKDRVKDVGPMGALYSALEYCDSEHVFFIPCDMPFITEETVFYLFNHMKEKADAVVYTANGRIFPTVGIYKKSALPLVAKQIESGNYKMMCLLDKLNTQYLQAPKAQQFRNINTPEEYNSIV